MKKLVLLMVIACSCAQRSGPLVPERHYLSSVSYGYIGDDKGCFSAKNFVQIESLLKTKDHDKILKLVPLFVDKSDCVGFWEYKWTSRSPILAWPGFSRVLFRENDSLYFLNKTDSASLHTLYQRINKTYPKSFSKRKWKEIKQIFDKGGFYYYRENILIK